MTEESRQDGLITDKVDLMAFATFPGLPRVSASKNMETGESIIIRRGHLGYWPAPGLDVDAFNALQKVLPNQLEAMIAGSMFGWHVPGADPDQYSPITGNHWPKGHERPAIASKQ